MTRKLTQGNEAVFRGALAAGASYYAGLSDQPVDRDPQRRLRPRAAEHPEFRFLQAEDEIASANAVIGASLAGAKSFTATSGPGFSLMQEAIGYAQKVGVPSVFVNVMRVGPATGMPTMPGQGDIMQVKWGSTGDYTPLAFYPNGVEEAFRLTVEAFNAAEESRSPVVVLSDTFVAHLNEVVDLDEIANRAQRRPARHPAARRVHGHSPASSPGCSCTSTGRTRASRQPPMRTSTCASSTRPSTAISRSPSATRSYEHGWKTDADVLIVCYGIVSRVAAPLRDEFALFRPIRIFPMLGRRAARDRRALPRDRGGGGERRPVRRPRRARAASAR